jgi:DNA-binding NtrC family response regulator
MLDCVVTLVSEDAHLIQAIEEGIRSIERLNLEVCTHADEALALASRGPLVLLDARTGHDDEELAAAITALGSSPTPCSVVVLSDRYRDEQAVCLLRAGAVDYLGLPADLGRVTYLMDTLTLRARFSERPPAGAEGGGRGQEQLPFVLDPQMAEMMAQIRRVVSQETTLLFTGETGTGKTCLARLIHELSHRREEPFQVVDCGALSANLIESEMFGHVKGAFTGAERDRAGKFSAAGSGTLLLDEVNSLPPALQSKLLRAVDERVFEPVGSNRPVPLRARLIAASNTRLDREVAEGRFRADLYYRLNVVGFYLPPLRDRRIAIPMLANRYLALFAARNARDIRRVAPDAMRALEEYDWPGNIRELRNVMERAASLCGGFEVRVNDLPEAMRSGRSWGEPRQPPCVAYHPPAERRAPSLKHTREEVEVLRITEALQKHGNNRLRAAAELGISRMALYKKLHKYGMMGTA